MYRDSYLWSMMLFVFDITWQCCCGRENGFSFVSTWFSHENNETHDLAAFAFPSLWGLDNDITILNRLDYLYVSFISGDQYNQRSFSSFLLRHDIHKYHRLWAWQPIKMSSSVIKLNISLVVQLSNNFPHIFMMFTSIEWSWNFIVNVKYFKLYRCFWIHIEFNIQV